MESFNLVLLEMFKPQRSQHSGPDSHKQLELTLLSKDKWYQHEREFDKYCGK